MAGTPALEQQLRAAGCGADTLAALGPPPRLLVCMHTKGAPPPSLRALSSLTSLRHCSYAIMPSDSSCVWWGEAAFGGASPSRCGGVL